jgi:toxin ParE1/3/4
MNLDLSKAASADLRAIQDYTLQTWGPRQEEIYLDRLWSRFESLLANPSPYRFRNDLFPNCQLVIEGKHAIFFRVEGDDLKTLRILHSAMDFKRHFPKQKGRREK